MEEKHPELFALAGAAICEKIERGSDQAEKMEVGYPANAY